MPDPMTLGLASAVTTCVTWGTADYLAAHVTRRIGEARTLLALQAVGVPVLVVAWLVVRPPLPDPASLAWITLASASFAVGYLAFFHGLRVGAISIVSPISSAGALIPVTAGIILFGEHPSTPRLAGVALTLAGLALLLTDFGAVRTLGAADRRRGALAGVVTLLAWGSGTALLLPAIKSAGGFSPIALVRAEILLVLLVWFAWRGAARLPSDSGLRNRSLWGCVVPAALLDLTAFFAYGFALYAAPATVVAPIASAYPLVTIAIARRRLHETLSRREWSGVALTLAGATALGVG
jgi:drug/metabolite transporter (DMT)-like permease